MKKTKKKKNKKVYLILIIIIFLGFVKGISSMVSYNKNSEKINFMLDNEILELKNEIYIDKNEVIYLSKADVESIFDNNIYYNEAEKELITTYNKHIAVLKINETFMVVNDTNIELKSSLIKKNKKVYLPLSEMGIVYDIELEYSKETKIVIADSLSKEKNEALILKATTLREKTSIFGKAIEKLSIGKRVVVIENIGKYSKIRTPNGNLGYVKTKKLTAIEKIRDNWEETKTEVNILETASDISKEYSKIKIDTNLNNVVIPEFFYIDTDKSILDKTGNATEEYTNYINWIESNNIDIWATLKNNIEVSNSLRTYTDRNKIINDIYYQLVNYKYQGINIDFEKIDDINSFNRFVIELTPRLKELGLKIAVTYNKNINKEKLEEIVDIIIE